MKKIVALALCLVMVIGLMSGCQKEKGMDLDTLIQKMDEAMKDITAQGMDAEMDLEMKMSVMGMTMTIDMEMDMEFQSKSDLSAMYMDMDMSMKALGQSEKTKAKMYGTMEDGEMVYYVYDGAEDIWAKTSQQNFSGTMGLYTGMEMGFKDIPKEAFSLAREQETINGRKCYVLNEQTDGSYLQDQMDDYMKQMLSQMTGDETMDEASMAEIEAIMETLDWSKLSVKAVYYVDTETYRTLEMSMEIEGMGELYDELISTMMEQMMMELDEEVPAFSVEVPTFKVVTSNMIYDDDVQIPDVPQEAIDNAIDVDSVMDDNIVDGPDSGDVSTNEPQEDGSYLLSLGDSYIRVMVPEDYIVYSSDEQTVSCTHLELMNYIDYIVIAEATEEDMISAIAEDIIWAKEEDYYKSHSDVTEQNGYHVMSLIYNDNTSCWYTWKELDGGVLMMVIEVEGETCDLSELLATVEIAVK